MTKYFIKRLFLGLLALFIAIFITYMLMATYLDSPVKIAGPKDFANIQKYRQNHLGLAPIVRFFYYVGDLFKGNTGTIFNPSVAIGNMSMSGLFFSKLKYSIMITGPVFVLSTILGFIFGFIAGYKRGTWIDTSINVFVIIFVAVPSFILALLVIIMGDKLGIPVQIITDKGTGILIKTIALPIILLTVTSFAGLTYYIRNEVVGVLSQDFVKVARSKGLSELKILFKHIIRNVMIPVSGMIIGGFMGLLSGSFILEIFFGLDGTASLLVSTVKQNEINVVMYQLLIFASIGVVITILIDFSYVALDPRISLGSTTKPSLKSRVKARRMLKASLGGQND